MTKSPTLPEKEGCRERIGSVQRHRGLSLSDLSEPECEPSRSARSTRKPVKCSPSTGQVSPATTTCEVLPLTGSHQMELLPMSSVAASPARTSVPQESAPASTEIEAAYGLKSPDLLASYDPDTSSWRTSQRCLVTGWEEFSETWPRSGMTRNGTAYQLQPLAPLTDATAFGSWPTPHGFSKDGKSNGPSGNELGRAVNRSLWPTPNASDASKWSNQSLQERLEKGQQVRLSTAVSPEGGAGGSLNPTWVEWLMGFPAEWTALSNSATPSSRKSRKSSGEQS